MLDPSGYRKSIRRFIWLRWIAGAVAFVAILAGWALHSDLSLAPALIVSLIVPLSNVAHLFLARREHSPRLLLLVQFGSDLSLLTLLLGTMGGIDGPSIWLFLFHVLLAPLFLRRRDALIVAGTAVGLMALLAVLQVSGAAFPTRDLALFSTLLGLDRPLAQSPALVVSQVAMLAVAAAIVLHILLPLAQEARDYQTRLEAAEAAARDQAAMVENILDNMGAMMMVLDDTHHIRWINQVVRERFPTFAIGQLRQCYNPAEPLGPGDQPLCPSCYVLATHEQSKGDYSLAITGAEPRVFRVYGTPFPTGDGHAIEVVELIVDVTEERKAEAQLIDARKTHAIAQLAAGVAHELNTPLASLGAGLWSLRQALERCAKAAQDESLGPVRALVDDLQTQTARCQHVTESMLSFSRQIHSHLEIAEVDGIIRAALSDLSQCRDLRGLEVVFQSVSPGTGVPPVECDPSHLRIVIVNVLTNSVDAVREAHREKGRVHVSVRATAERQGVEIHIKDNGVGIAPEIKQHLFEPFFSVKPVGKGTGLGLSVSRGLLEGMGGTIAIESEEGKGCLVVISLRAGAGARPTISTEKAPQA